MSADAVASQEVSKDSLKSAIGELIAKAKELPLGAARTLLNEYLNHAVRLINGDPLGPKIIARMGQIEARFHGKKFDAPALFSSLGDRAVELGKLIENGASDEQKGAVVSKGKAILGDLSKSLFSDDVTKMEKRLGVTVAQVMVAVAAAHAAGFRGADLITFTAIAGAESSYNPSNATYGPTDKSFGLWQVNLKGSLSSRIPEICRLSGKSDAIAALKDPNFNALYSKRLYDSKIADGKFTKRFFDWSAYKTGMHAKFTGIATIAVNQYLASIGEQSDTRVG